MLSRKAGELAEQVRKTIAEQFGKPLEQVLPRAKLVEDLGGDSLEATELVMALEEKYSIEISDNMVQGLKTVKDVQELVIKLKLGESVPA